MSCAVEFEKLNKATNETETFFGIDEKKQDLLDKQIKPNHTAKQKEVADALVKVHSKMEGVNQEFYIDKLGKPYKRVTQFIKDVRGGYYSFNKKDYNEEDYEINREWGNIVDTVFEGIIFEKSGTEIINDVVSLANGMSIGPKAVTAIQSKIQEIKKLHPNALMLPQLNLSSSIGVAGTLDLLLVEPDGSVFIYDLKTSDKPITQSRTVEDAYGNKYKSWYNKPFKNKKSGKMTASKQEMHSIQLNFYNAFLKENLGIEASGLAIIPGVITVDENSNIVEVEFEDTFEHETDTALLDTLDKSSTREEFITDLTDTTNTDFFTEVISALEEQVKILKAQKKYDSIPLINTMIENIQVGKGMKEISEFIEYMHEEFVYGDNSLEDRVREFLDQVDSGEIVNPEKILRQLQVYKDEITLFEGITRDLNRIAKDLNIFDEAVEKDTMSNKAKIRAIFGGFTAVKEELDDKVIPIIAKILSEQLPKNKEYKEAITQKIESIKKRLQQTNLSNKRRKALQEELKLNQSRLNLNDETIIEMLKTGNYKDISIIESKLLPAVSMDNAIIATFAKTIKAAFEKARIKLFKLERVAYKAFEEYAKYSKDKLGISQNNVAKFNEPFYETIDDGFNDPYLAFVQKLDYVAYRKAMDSLKEGAKEKAKELKAKGKYKNMSVDSLTRKLVLDMSIEKGYRVAIPQEDITITNPYDKKQVVTLRLGLKSLLNNHKKTHSEKVHKSWVVRNFKLEDGQLVPRGNQLFMPNEKMFNNKKYEAMAKDEAKFKYYKFLISVFRSGQNSIQDEFLHYKLPGIEKTENDRLRENGVKDWAKRFMEGTIGYLPEAEEQFGENLSDEERKAKELQDPNNLEREENSQIKRRIPHLYSRNIGVENTSVDLIGSVLRYTAAAEKYAAQTAMEPVGNTLLDAVKKVGPMYDSNASWSEVLSKHKSFGEYYRKHNGNGVAATLEALIDTQIYGINRTGNNKVANKITDILKAVATMTQIGGKPVLAVANSLAAHISTAIDAYGNEFFSPSTWMWAKVEYRKNEVNFIKDMFSSTKKSKLGQLTQLYDALQGEYMDEFGRKMSQGAVKKMWGSKGWFSLMHKGEHAAQSKVMMALLKETMIETLDGKEISLYDAYELDPETGDLRVKDNVDPKHFFNEEVRNKLHSLNKRFNGVYNSFDAPDIKRSNMGRLLIMYRDFITPAVRRRLKGYGVDYESGTVQEGYYQTFFRVLFTDAKQMMLKASDPNNNLTSHERANVRRMAAEILYMVALSTLIGLLTALTEAGDEDEYTLVGYKAMEYSLYWSMRAMSELSFYNFGLGNTQNWLLPLNLGGTLRTFRTPSPAYSILEKSFRAINNTVYLITGSDNAYYKRDANYNTIFGELGKKGDPKAVASWLKLMGINGQSTDITNAIKILNLYN